MQEVHINQQGIIVRPSAPSPACAHALPPSLTNIDTLIMPLRWTLQPALHLLFSCTLQKQIKATVAVRQQPAREQLNTLSK